MALSLRFSNFFRSSQRFNSWKSHARNLTYTKKISDFSIFETNTNPTRSKEKSGRGALGTWVVHPPSAPWATWPVVFATQWWMEGAIRSYELSFPIIWKCQCGLFFFFATKNYPKMAMVSVKMPPIMVIVLVFKVNIPPKVPADWDVTMSQVVILMVPIPGTFAFGALVVAVADG